MSGSLNVLARDAALAMLAQILARGSLVVAAALIASGLEVSQFSAYSFFHLTVNTIATYAGLGVAVSAAKTFASVAVESETSREDIAVLWLISSVIALAVILLAYVGGEMLFAFDMRVSSLQYSVAIGLIVLGVVPSGGINGMGAFGEAAIVAIPVALVVVLGSAVASSQASLDGAIWVLIAGFGLRTCGEAAICLRRVGWPKFRVGRRRLEQGFRRVSKMIGPLALVSIFVATGIWSVGRIILSARGEREFALFAIGLQWYGLGLLVPGVIARVLFARQVKLASSRSSDGRRHRLRLLHQGMFSSIGATLLVALLCATLDSRLIAFYGPAYANDSWVITAFLFASTIKASASLLGNSLVVRNGQRAHLALTAVEVIILVAGVVLMRSMGTLGAVLSIGISGFVMLGFRYFVECSREKKR